MVHTNRHGPWRPWLIAWLGAAALGVANGVARGALYERRIGSRPAHFLSTGALLVLLSAYMRVLSRAWPIASRGQALQIGFVWAGLTHRVRVRTGTSRRPGAVVRAARAVQHRTRQGLGADSRLGRN